MSQISCGLAVVIHTPVDGGDRQYPQKDQGAKPRKMILVVREEFVNGESPR